MIEKNIFQIYHNKSLIPPSVSDHLRDLCPDYQYRLVDFSEGKRIVRENMPTDEAHRICKTIDQLPRYCHKSDLLRYCLLHIYGGFYIDCDLKLCRHPSEI